MKTAERILVGLTAICAILKMLYIPGGAIGSTLLMSLLSLFYFTGWYFLFNPKKKAEFNGIVYEKVGAARLVMAIITGMSLGAALIGILFKLMHWPGAAAMLLISGLAIGPIAVIAVILYLNKKEDFFRQIAMRCLAMSIVAALMLFFA